MKGETAKVLERALDILRQLAADPQGTTLTELSSTIGLPVSTTRRFLITLARRDFVVLDSESERYRLGLAVLGLSTTIQRSNELARVAQPVLDWLRDQSNETASVRVRMNETSLVIAVAESSHLVRFVHPIGEQTPLHAGASGKVILASLPTDELDAVLDQIGSNALTEKTIVDRDALLGELEAVREQGFAISQYEVTHEAAAVSAPITGPSGQLLGTVALTCPSMRASSERLNEYAPLVIEAGRRIAAGMVPTQRPKVATLQT